ncbi:hypothetical protein HH212_22350 [Massilia forsythiae]|uniref:Uncharacterized protein n=1 Tax=Massilia forsythiae TaxID=2728020 RepID=A0A7Z2ZUH5_9BURK|nr:hypothetical protein [Massilia forsythiae]QJE02424.1 hypothetical protein HH212_22350 [Massilia forsythiae]
MEKLIAELARLYLATDVDGAGVPASLAGRLRGEDAQPLALSYGGLTRAIVIAFDERGKDEESQPWPRLCALANALQADLGLPAPAVSIAGDHGYRLWLSLAAPVPLAQAQAFVDLLRRAYPEMDRAGAAADAPVALPPCLHPASGKWAAFIHPGMGAAFADEAGLDMAPPSAGQAALLEGLESIGAAAFARALAVLRQAHGVPAATEGPLAATTVAAPAAPGAASGMPAVDAAAAAHPAYAGRTAAPSTDVPEGLLLKDATLEDIVRCLHAKNIEPTFRHLLPG